MDINCYRIWVPNRKGRCSEKFSAGKISKYSVVHISVSEATALGPAPIGGDQSWKAFRGSASITVQNVSPNDGFVEFYAYADWRTPINLVYDITVINGAVGPNNHIYVGR